MASDLNQATWWKRMVGIGADVLAEACDYPDLSVAMTTKY